MATSNTHSTLAKVVAYFEKDVETEFMANILRNVYNQYAYHICTLPDEDRPADVKENLYFLNSLQEALDPNVA